SQPLRRAAAPRLERRGDQEAGRPQRATRPPRSRARVAAAEAGAPGFGCVDRRAGRPGEPSPLAPLPSPSLPPSPGEGKKTKLFLLFSLLSRCGREGGVGRGGPGR